MAGTYNGSWHGGNDFTNQSVFEVQAGLKAAAASNVAAASNGGTTKVMSADGKRVLFDPKTQKLNSQGKVVDKKPSDAKTAKKTAKKTDKVVAVSINTTGPGTALVGSAPTAGAGVPAVGKADTAGPGIEAVVVPYAPRDGGVSPVITGPGLGVVTSGSAFKAGAPAGLLGVGVGAPSAVTEVFIGGNKIPRDPLTSDAQEIEDAYGEAEFLSPGFFMSWGAFAANAWHGLEQNMRQHITPVPPDIGVDRTYEIFGGRASGVGGGKGW